MLAKFSSSVSNLRHLQEQEGNATRATLLGGIVAAEFHGASGVVAFGNEGGNERNSDTIAIGIYNIRPNKISNAGTQSLHATLVFRSNNFKWESVKGEAITYRDGTSILPNVEREFISENYLSKGVRSIGILLMAIAWMLALASLVALHFLTKDPVVQQAQPYFLKMLCYGSILTSAAILTISFDEGSGWTDSQLDIACALTPWFFFTGNILTFCALFTKLWRVDKVLQFRRRAVSVRNVLIPR